MTRLLDLREGIFGSRESPIGFEPDGSDASAWERFLTVNGVRAYYLGNFCNTCSFMFERLPDARRLDDEPVAVEALGAGLVDLADPAVQILSGLLPVGGYAVCMLETLPRLVAPGSAGDYFTHEQVALWGVDGSWGLPHYPRVEYYRAGDVDVDIGIDGRLFEFVIPMFPRGQLDPGRVGVHCDELRRGRLPTAVAISVLDVKFAADAPGDATIDEHWCLAHYLLDGHHKVFASAQTELPITLLSFLALGRGASTSKQTKTLLERLRSPDARP
jgi:hypothetical protein